MQDLKVGDWIARPSSNRLERDGRVISIQPKAMDVLCCLAKHAGEVVSHEVLLNEVWPDTHPEEQVVRRRIAELRAAFGDQAQRSEVIETLPKRGYRLLTPTHPLLNSDSAKRRLALTDTLNTESTARTSHSSRSSRPTRVVFAVMPFENLTGHPDRDYLGDVVAAEVWNGLAGVAGLPLISMSSTRHLRSTNLDVVQIGTRLKATHVVEGNLVSAAGILRINVQLSNAESAQTEWSESLDWTMTGTDQLFSICDEVAQKVVRSLPSALRLPAEDKRPTTPKLEAYLLLERARYLVIARATIVEAIDLVDEALVLDPDYTRAITMKANLLASAAQEESLPPSAYDEAEELARRAMSKAPDYPMSYVALASIYQCRDADIPRAIFMYQQAVERGALIDKIGNLVEDLFVKAGEWEALLTFVEGRELFDPNNSWLMGQKARALSMLGRHEEAACVYDSALRRYPNNKWLAWTALTHYIWRERNFSKAERIIRNNPSATWSSPMRRQLDAARGRPQELLARMDELSQLELPPCNLLTHLYFDLRIYDKHIEWSRRGPHTYVVPTRGNDYWRHLEAWAVSDSATRKSRQALLQEYRAEIESRRANAYFPVSAIDFAQSMLASRFRRLPLAGLH